MSSERTARIEQLQAEVRKEYGRTSSMVLAPHLIRGSGVSEDDKIGIAKELCKRAFKGKLFVSHTGDDARWCLENILPVVQESCGAQSYFFMSLATNSEFANMYRVLVEYSFYWSKTVILVLSKRSIASDWVQLEANWAVAQRHPTIICRLDETRPDQIHVGLRKERRWSLFKPPIRFIDFRRPESDARRALGSLLRTKQFGPATGHTLNMNMAPQA